MADEVTGSTDEFPTPEAREELTDGKGDDEKEGQ